jgi:hypothetical protein
MRLRALLLTLLTVSVLLWSACGSDRSADSPSTPSREGTPADGAKEDETAPSASEERVDESIERSLEQRRRAAAAGDRAAVARAEDRLVEWAERRPEGDTGPPVADPFERMLEAFEFKTAPLYVETITSSDDSHRLFVSVDKNAFCLMTPAARRRAVEAVYLRADRMLRSEGVDDFAFILVPLTSRAPATRLALARGRGGRVRMIAGPRGC